MFDLLRNQDYAVCRIVVFWVCCGQLHVEWKFVDGVLRGCSKGLLDDFELIHKETTRSNLLTGKRLEGLAKATLHENVEVSINRGRTALPAYDTVSWKRTSQPVVNLPVPGHSSSKVKAGYTVWIEYVVMS
jgi:hypothetical protein